MCSCQDSCKICIFFNQGFSLKSMFTIVSNVSAGSTEVEQDLLDLDHQQTSIPVPPVPPRPGE